MKMMRFLDPIHHTGYSQFCQEFYQQFSAICWGILFVTCVLVFQQARKLDDWNFAGINAGRAFLFSNRL